MSLSEFFDQGNHTPRCHGNKFNERILDKGHFEPNQYHRMEVRFLFEQRKKQFLYRYKEASQSTASVNFTQLISKRVSKIKSMLSFLRIGCRSDISLKLLFNNRYIGMDNGVFRIFPGIELPDFDPRKQLW